MRQVILTRDKGGRGGKGAPHHSPSSPHSPCFKSQAQAPSLLGSLLTLQCSPENPGFLGSDRLLGFMRGLLRTTSLFGRDLSTASRPLSHLPCLDQGLPHPPLHPFPTVNAKQGFPLSGFLAAHGRQHTPYSPPPALGRRHRMPNQPCGAGRPQKQGAFWDPRAR